MVAARKREKEFYERKKSAEAAKKNLVAKENEAREKGMSYGQLVAQQYIEQHARVEVTK